MSDLDQGGYQNVQMVVERDRSYMVATTTDGTVSRISPFGKRRYTITSKPKN